VSGVFGVFYTWGAVPLPRQERAPHTWGARESITPALWNVKPGWYAPKARYQSRLKMPLEAARAPRSPAGAGTCSCQAACAGWSAPMSARLRGLRRVLLFGEGSPRRQTWWRHTH